jgi:hypothetical protein
MLILLGGWMLLLAGLTWLLCHCLSVGRVGSFGGDAIRSSHPIRFWTSIAVLAVVVITMACVSVYATWKVLT